MKKNWFIFENSKQYRIKTSFNDSYHKKNSMKWAPGCSKSFELSTLLQNVLSHFMSRYIPIEFQIHLSEIQFQFFIIFLILVDSESVMSQNKLPAIK